MYTTEAVNAVLKKLKTMLEKNYGSRLNQMFLYGSYARGDAVEGSDVDILLVLDNVQDPLNEREQLSSLLWELALEHQMVFSVLPVDTKTLNNRNSPLFLNIRREGIVI
jgi:predicted nucleotidyltransferase